MPAFRGEEVLLNRAEAYIFDNKLSQALADLQVMVNNRYDGNRVINTTTLRSYYGTTNDRLNAFYFILDERRNQSDFREAVFFERRKEFMHEGLRWFDIKRFQIPVTHMLADGSTIELDADDDRQVLQIPQAAIDIGGLQPNPR